MVKLRRNLGSLSSTRRDYLARVASLVGVCVLPPPSLADTEIAIGSAERACRERGDCLQTGNFDGALGFNWGGRDRCDARDPTCRTGGKVEGAEVDFTPPLSAEKVTDVVEVTLSVGRDETLKVRMGLFGDKNPTAASQVLKAFSSEGLVTGGPRLAMEDGYGISSIPILASNAVLTYVGSKSGTVTLGLPSQGKVYAKVKNVRKAPAEFVPQPRPPPIAGIPGEAGDLGMVMMASKGLGYIEEGGDLDEAFERLIELRGYGSEGGSGKGRVAVGQLMDRESMESIYRLSTLPINKKFQGIVGVVDGPPLVNVKVVEVEITKEGEGN